MMPEYPISAPSPLRRGSQGGFTLVELVIAMVVAAILTAIAIPMYMHQVRESRRTDARSALLDLAGREERYYATNSAYTNSSVNLGYTTTAQGSSWPQSVGSGYYQISQPTVPAAAIAAPSYSISATPTGTQVADTTCASFTVTSTGQQTAQDTSGNDQSATCWGQ